MLQLMFLNIDDVPNLVSTDGFIQLAIIVLSVVVAMFSVTYIKLRPNYKSMIIKSKFKAAIMGIFLPTLIFFLVSLITGGVYALFTHTKLLLVKSVSIVSLLVYLISVITFLIDQSFVNENKYYVVRLLLKFMLWIIFLSWITNLDVVIAQHLATIFITFGSTKISLWSIILNCLFVFYSISLVLWAIVVFENFILVKLHSLEHNERLIISRLFKVFATFICIYVVLPTFGVNLTGLSVFGGGIGVGIGLGLQKIASNFISGFIILIDKSVKIGDRIVINGTTGKITQITVRYTVMEAFDGSEVIIPNEQFTTSTVVNLTHSNQDIGLELTVSVGYSSDLKFVIALIKQIVNSHDLINQNKDPSIVVKKLADSGIEIFIRVWPKDALNDMSTIRNDLNILIIEQFKLHNIEIPFPKMDVTLLNSVK